MLAMFSPEKVPGLDPKTGGKEFRYSMALPAVLETTMVDHSPGAKGAVARMGVEPEPQSNWKKTTPRSMANKKKSPVPPLLLWLENARTPEEFAVFGFTLREMFV